MTTIDRVEVLDILAKVAEKYPQWRMGQLVANLSGWADRDIWDMEDEELIEAARSHLEQRAVKDDAA